MSRGSYGLGRRGRTPFDRQLVALEPGLASAREREHPWRLPGAGELQ
jgi:hypothetical protein